MIAQRMLQKEILLPPGAGGRLHFGVVPRDFLEHAKQQTERRQLGTELMRGLHGLWDTRCPKAAAHSTLCSGEAPLFSMTKSASLRWASPESCESIFRRACAQPDLMPARVNF